MKDELGTRMKFYEAAEAQRRFQNKIVCARIDGRNFSNFSRGFAKPYDEDLAAAMKFACRTLVDETRANIGFVQSDEISLVWDVPDEGSQMIFDGRVQKLTSVLASKATVAFCVSLSHVRPDAVNGKMPHFDARVWTVPTQIEAANTILWRSQDARKNGVSSAARANMSAKKMHGLDQQGMVDAMLERGVEYHSAYPEHHKYGTFYQRRRVVRLLTAEELERIPERHREYKAIAPVQRSQIAELDICYFGDVENRVGVIFESEEPVFRKRSAV